MPRRAVARAGSRFVVRDAVLGGVSQDGPQRPRQPLAPGNRAFPRCNEILAHLDEGVGQAMKGGVAVHGVARQRAVIRLVVADDEAGLRGERRDQAGPEGADRNPRAPSRAKGAQPLSRTG